MKKILITGADSYIGTSFERYIKENYPMDFSVDTICMIDGSWRNYDFSGYDAVFHVAGIAHQKETKQNAHLYYEVNEKLVIETAAKAKKEGVSQFVFLSSMSIYGLEEGCISSNTMPTPKTNYGRSKLLAEQGLTELNSDFFSVAIVRPPMVYGKGCPGNYAALSWFALKMKIFPNIKNARSMIYVENLCEFVKLLIDNVEKGCFYPQNTEYVNTSNMVHRIASSSGKNILLTRLFNPLIWMLRKHRIIKKVFGNLYYEQDLSKYKEEYNRISFEKSIEKTNG